MSRITRVLRRRGPEFLGASLALLLVGGLAAYHFRPADYADGWPSNQAAPNRGAVDAAAASVVGVLACSDPVCDADPIEPFDSQVKQLGSGWVVSPGRVVTTAHLVTGAQSTGVQIGGIGGTGRFYQGTVVLYDPGRDLAVLAVPGLPAPALPLAVGAPLHRTDHAIVAGYTNDGSGPEYTLKGTVLIEYGRSTTPGRRLSGQESYQLTYFGQDFAGEFGIRAFGLSVLDGSPLLDGSGHVVGIAYPSQGDSGLALTLAAARPVLDAAAGATTPVSTGTL